MPYNEDKIIEKLEHIEAQLSPLLSSAQSMREFKEDLKPITNQAFRLLMDEFEDVESSVQLEDILLFIKRLLRSIRDLNYSLNQLENIIDFITTLEPLLKSSVPQIINYLDDLEQRGILRIILSFLDIRAKIAKAYKPEDIDQIGDGIVTMLGVMQRLSDPKAAEFVNKFAQIPASVDLSKSKPVSPLGAIKASFDPDVRQGLGVLLELTKAMGRTKNNGSKTGT
jgi:uncharacterized protein YjgD (DUF1641 family)